MASPLPLPPTPTPWQWQCHKCQIWYPLSCTRRCLNCSHIFCQETIRKRSINTTNPVSSPRLSRQAQIRRKKQKKAGPCSSKFDFDGWAAWGSWRRLTTTIGKTTEAPGRGHALSEYLRKKEVREAAYLTWRPKEPYMGGNRLPARRWFPRSLDSQSEVLQRKEEMFLERAHDCSVHCDYPNECGLGVFAATERLVAAAAEAQAQAETEAGFSSSDDDGLCPAAWRDELDFEIYRDPVLPPVKDIGDESHEEQDLASGDDPTEQQLAEETDTPVAPVLTSATLRGSDVLTEKGPEEDEYLDWTGDGESEAV